MQVKCTKCVCWSLPVLSPQRSEVDQSVRPTWTPGSSIQQVNLCGIAHDACEASSRGSNRAKRGGKKKEIIMKVCTFDHPFSTQEPLP